MRLNFEAHKDIGLSLIHILQLLEEGKFTDSLGREYDLDKYIIIFTSNMPKERIGEFLPPELRSRFSYKCAFWPLSTQEKEQYVAFKLSLIHIFRFRTSVRYAEISQ